MTPILCSSTADEEPLVDRGVDLLRGQVLVRRERGELVSVDAAWRVGDGQVGTKMRS